MEFNPTFGIEIWQHSELIVYGINGTTLLLFFFISHEQEKPSF